MILINFPTSKVRILDLLSFDRVSSLFSASFFFASKLLRMSFAVSLLSSRTLRNFFACLSQFRYCLLSASFFFASKLLRMSFAVSLLSRRPLGLRIVPPPLGLRIVPPLLSNFVTHFRNAVYPFFRRSVSLLSPRRSLCLLSRRRSVSLLSPRRPLGFLIIPPKAAPFAHCPSAARFPYCPPAARFAYCPAAARFRYCPPEGRLVSLLSPRRPLRLRIVLPPLGFLIVPPTSFLLWSLRTSHQAITPSSLLLFPRPGGMREAIK